MVEADKKAPVNYAHESWQKAAAGISKMRVSEDGQKLLASVDWTPAGA
ncbi:hypothetical protein ABI214_24135 [Prescottella soli]|uniref:Uncharacterized protein n=1 Tax=Prescottella soli TaxID=1543852 RepID=A0ABW9FUU9_9NOCA